MNLYTILFSRKKKTVVLIGRFLKKAEFKNVIFSFPASACFLDVSQFFGILSLMFLKSVFLKKKKNVYIEAISKYEEESKTIRKLLYTQLYISLLQNVRITSKTLRHLARTPYPSYFALDHEFLKVSPCLMHRKDRAYQN